MATAEQLDILRAMVTADFERHDELLGQVSSEGGWEGYGEVIGAAFYIAVRKQFPDGANPQGIIRLVADVRERLDRTGDDIDPRAAELLVRSALGEADLASQLADATVVQLQMVTVSVLAAEERLGTPDDFMNEVKALLDRWAS